MNENDLRTPMPAELRDGVWHLTDTFPPAFDWALLDNLEQTDCPAGIRGRLDHSFYLFHYASLLPSGALIVEIGTRDGVSAVTMAMALKGRGGHIVTIDPGLLYRDEIVNRQHALQKYEFVAGDIHRVLRNVRSARVEGYVTPVPDTSGDVLSRWDGRLIDMLFVDGSHTYADVTIDCEWMKYVKSGGIAVFDDWIEPVERAVREYVTARPEQWKIVTESTRQEPGRPWKTALYRS